MENVVENFLRWEPPVRCGWFILARRIRFFELRSADWRSYLRIIADSECASCGSQSFMQSGFIVTFSHRTIPRLMPTSRSLELNHLEFITAAAHVSIVARVRSSREHQCCRIFPLEKGDELGWELSFPFCVGRKPSDFTFAIVPQRMATQNFRLCHLINHEVFTTKQKCRLNLTITQSELFRSFPLVRYRSAPTIFNVTCQRYSLTSIVRYSFLEYNFLLPVISMSYDATVWVTLSQ